MDGNQVDSENFPVHKDITGGMKLGMEKGEAIDYARIEAVSGEGDQISRVDATQLESHIEPLTCHLHGEIGLDGVIEGSQVSNLLDCGNGVTPVSEESVKEL